MVVVGPERVLFAKNSDRDPNEAQLLDWQPRRTHPSGTRLRCTWIEIDQAERTHAVLLSRPFWMWGAEIGANEHGLVVGNEAVFTREPSAEVGLTGMDLLRLTLERATTAEAGVETLTTLLERHGQGGGCGHEHREFTYHNSFLLADGGRAYVVETAGRRWAVEEVRSGARSISNCLTIPGFARRHSDHIRTHFSRGRVRRAITQTGAARAHGPGDLMALVRDHGTGGPTPRYSPINGAMTGPCMHAGGLAAASQTTASWVAELRPGRATHWVTATAAPCTAIFKPVRVDEPLDLGPAPVDRFDARCLWWRHEVFHRRVMTDPARNVATFAAERDEIEARWLADPPEPAAAFAEADRLLERWTGALEGDARDTRPPWVRRYWRVRDRRGGLAAADIETVAALG